MIYLIKTSSMVIRDMNDPSKDEVVFVYKIGYSNDRRGLSRFTDYRSQGHIIRILKYIPGGSILLEQALQEKFRKYNLPGRSKEWFYESEEILDCFNSCTTEKDLYNLFDCDNDEGIAVPKTEKKEKHEKSAEERGSRNQSESSRLFYKYKKGKSEEELLKDSKYLILLEFNTFTTFKDRMKYLCSLRKDIVLSLSGAIPEEFLDYYRVIGLVRCKKLQYKRESLLRELDSVRKCESSDLKSRLVDEFKIGERYSRIYIKNKLSEIYLDLGIQKTSKAVDILNYFETRDTYITRKESCDGDMKRDKGYLILGVKL